MKVSVKCVNLRIYLEGKKKVVIAKPRNRGWLCACEVVLRRDAVENNNNNKSSVIFIIVVPRAESREGAKKGALKTRRWLRQMHDDGGIIQ